MNDLSEQEPLEAPLLEASLLEAPNVFEQILLGKLPAKRVYEDEKVLAFWDIAPKAPVHLLLIPKALGMVNIQRMQEEELAIMVDLTRAARAIATSMELAGYRLVTNVGYLGGQRVPHLHLHLLANVKGKELPW